MNYTISDVNEDSAVLSLKKNENGNVELLANDGRTTNVILVIKKSGGYARIPFITIPYFNLDEEGKIEEEEL